MLGLGAMELLIIAVTLLLLFGGTRLPRLARNVADARRELQAADDPSTGETRSPV